MANRMILFLIKFTSNHMVFHRFKASSNLCGVKEGQVVNENTMLLRSTTYFVSLLIKNRARCFNRFCFFIKKNNFKMYSLKKLDYYIL